MENSFFILMDIISNSIACDDIDSFLDDLESYLVEFGINPDLIDIDQVEAALNS
ncbi:hypothetical protein [Vibrio campbellii]|uniref:hypothetical protein n=1 Tax=Vibrio campbellii TaxID=680 RepID=UPI00249C205A|nr:hypothetical protein [Vibrio campbellii]